MVTRQRWVSLATTDCLLRFALPERWAGTLRLFRPKSHRRSDFGPMRRPAGHAGVSPGQRPSSSNGRTMGGETPKQAAGPWQPPEAIDSPLTAGGCHVSAASMPRRRACAKRRTPATTVSKSSRRWPTARSPGAISSSGACSRRRALIAAKNGLSVYAPSAYGQVPTGAPRSPLVRRRQVPEPMHRPLVQTPYPARRQRGTAMPCGRGRGQPGADTAKKFSWHNEFSANPGDPRYVNPVTGKGPVEGRPPGEFFAHQRWTATGPDSDLFPKVGYLMSIGQMRGRHPLQCRDAGAERQCHVVVRAAAARPCRQPGRLAPRLWRAVPVQAALWRARRHAHLQRPAGRPRAATAASGATRSRRISTTPITAPRATAPATPIISPAPSTTTTGAWPWPGATCRACGATSDRDYLRKASGPDDGGGLQSGRGRLPRDSGQPLDARPPLLLHRGERAQGHVRARATSIAARIGAREDLERRHQPAPAERLG